MCQSHIHEVILSTIVYFPRVYDWISWVDTSSIGGICEISWKRCNKQTNKHTVVLLKHTIIRPQFFTKDFQQMLFAYLCSMTDGKQLNKKSFLHIQTVDWISKAGQG